MPNALVTGSPELVRDIAIALQSAGFDILAAGPISADAATFQASHRRPDPRPWWFYASVDPDLDFADWRDSILCLTGS